jgi:hypothetical protein
LISFFTQSPVGGDAGLQRIADRPKLRRRIKRLLESAKEPPIILNELNSQHPEEAHAIASISVVDAIKMLKISCTQRDVENVLNGFILPDIKEAESSDLKIVLEHLEKQIFINKVIRRRISRLIFAISSEDERKELKVKQVQSKIDHEMMRSRELRDRTESNAPETVEKVLYNLILSNCDSNITNSKSFRVEHSTNVWVIFAKLLM